MRYRFPIVCVFICILIAGCGRKPAQLDNGIWRGTFQTDSTIEIPFNFEVYDSAGTKQIAFINGEERLNINELQIEGDSVFFRTPLYETEIRAKLGDKTLEGTWVRTLPNLTQSMPFTAEYGADWRFVKEPKASKADVSGRWSVVFTKENTKDTTLAIGEFVQEGNLVQGTFLTNYGDYRFLSGKVDGDMLRISAYGGMSPSLFTATISGDAMTGDMYSGPANHSKWQAKKDPNAALADAYSLTKLKEGYNTLSFEFPDTDGNLVSLSGDRYKNKVVILQFLGSWCPNCMDETIYLNSFYKKYKEKGAEVLALAYERYAEPERAKKAVTNLMDRFDMAYPVLLTGYTNSQVLESLPEMESFNAFPSTIIINKKGEVHSIHTGFNGPATGQAYVDYITQFEQTITELLAE